MEINNQLNSEQPISAQPESATTPSASQPSDSGKKIPAGLIVGIIALVAIIAGVAIAVTIFKSSSPAQPSASATPSSIGQTVQQLPIVNGEDLTSSISQQVNGTVINDVDSQFKDIDANLNQL